MPTISRVFPRFENKWVMVTGAGTGFGRTLAKRAAAEGANVVVHYNNSKKGADETADAVRELGREAVIVQADIKSWDQIKAMIETAWAKTGSIDVLMNNVGDIATDQKDWREIDEKIIDRVLAVDIKGTMLMIHEMGTRMLERGKGNIVNIASTVVVRGSPGRHNTRRASTASSASPNHMPTRLRRQCASTRSARASWRPRRS